MTADRQLLEAALLGYEEKRRLIDARVAEIREALKSPIQILSDSLDAVRGDAITPTRMVISTAGERHLARIGERVEVNGDTYTVMDRIGADIRKRLDSDKRTRQMSAEGRAAISRASKKRWAKWRKEQKSA